MEIKRIDKDLDYLRQISKDVDFKEDLTNEIEDLKKYVLETNGFAIAGLIVSIFVSALVGLILSIIGLSKAKTLNNGKGLAIAGIVISIIKMVLAVIIVIACWGLILGLFGIVSS